MKERHIAFAMEKEAFRPRPAAADKYSIGVVCVAGGAPRYPHAPVIAALGARAAGAGLVHLVAPEESRFAAGAHVPEATFLELDGGVAPPRADVAVVGMGLEPSGDGRMLFAKFVSGGFRRVVADAGALSVMAAMRGGKAGLGVVAEGVELVITPHEGEAARLLGCERADVAADRKAAALELAGVYGATVALKGAHTLVVSSDRSRTYENETGNPCLAAGGAGDLLSGVIGARWAYLKGDPFVAVASSVWLHGAAADAVVAGGRDPSMANIASAIGSMRVKLETAGDFAPLRSWHII